MLKVERTEVYGWEAAIRGMRNPMNSWDKSDSVFGGKFSYGLWDNVSASIGTNDYELMMKLAAGGAVHAKYRRMITVSCDITAPLYWWKEFDTYKVGTVANSCSTMHKIHAKEFTLDDFSHDHLFDGYDLRDDPNNDLECYENPTTALEYIIAVMNHYRRKFLDCTVSKYATAAECAERKKSYWWQMIQLLPTSYNQKRTVMLNYEVLVGVYRDRRNHKLDEWHTLCDWIRELPYSEIITGGES